MNITRETQEPKSRDNFVAELNIDEVIESRKFPEDTHRYEVEEETDYERNDNAGTFFTEGMLEELKHNENNELLVVIDNNRNKIEGDVEVCSDFKTDLEVDRPEEPVIEASQSIKNSAGNKPSVKFKHKNIEQKDKFSKTTSIPYKPYSNSCRSHSQNGEKDIVYPFFGDSLQFLPSIQSDKGKFPSRHNLHHKRIFVRYVTNKIEKEHEFISMIRSHTMPLQTSGIKIAASNQLKWPSKIHKEATYVSTKEPDYYDTKAIFAGPPPPPPSAKFRSLSNKHFPVSIQRSKSQTAPSFKKFVTEIDEDLMATNSINFDSNKMVQSNVNIVNNIVDINLISSSSKLAGHYLYESKQRLSDLNLTDVWPSSSMYKVTIKDNPWVSSFKAKHQAHEINSTFRDNFDSNLNFSRLNSSGGVNLKKSFQNNFFPNIKNML